jgi:hypothetical protein
MTGLHTYTIELTPDFLTFAVDGQVLRRSTPAETENSVKWPQTPMRLSLGTWVGGKASVSNWTLEWAGGMADWSQAPFVGIYKSVKITDYGGGHTGAREYVYGDTSGKWQSIKVIGGTVNPMPGSDGTADTGSGGSSTDSPNSTATGTSSNPTQSVSTNPASSAPTQTPNLAPTRQNPYVASLVPAIVFFTLFVW